MKIMLLYKLNHNASETVKYVNLPLQLSSYQKRQESDMVSFILGAGA